MVATADRAYWVGSAINRLGCRTEVIAVATKKGATVCESKVRESETTFILPSVQYILTVIAS